MPTYNVENTNDTNLGGDLLLVNKLRTFPEWTEKWTRGMEVHLYMANTRKP